MRQSVIEFITEIGGGLAQRSDELIRLAKTTVDPKERTRLRQEARALKVTADKFEKPQQPAMGRR